MPTAAELKRQLKAAKMSQTGDKGTLESRLGLFKTCEDLKLTTADGRHPCHVSFGDLKKIASKVGVSPIGSQDEILTEYINYLKTHASSSGNNKEESNNNPTASAATGGGRTMAQNIALAQKVIELSEIDDFEAILNLSSPATPLTSKSPVAALRKAYLKLSLVLHPDKLRGFDKATVAFQGLVRAFERLSSPEQYEEEETKKRKKDSKQLARSNVGCKRTQVLCPRCHVPWSSSTLDGNPDYFYNFLMTGLKSFTCSTCLLEFGCMSALHVCPYCKQFFEYSPQDYHRKITCGNAGCDKEFGFYMFHASDRAIKDVKATVKAEYERRMKTVEQKRRREQSRKRRGAVDDSLQEEAFCLGLVDACPRCGEDLSSFDDELEMRQHLMNCNDEKKIKAHTKKKAKEKVKEAKKQAQEDAQLDAQSTATWEMLGGKTEQLWMLTDSALHKQAENAGIKVSKNADKDELIQSLVASAGKGNFLSLTAGSSSKSITATEGNRDRKRKRSMLTAETLPTNYHTFSYSQLKSVCAAHGFRVKGSTKSEVLAEIENELFVEDKSGPLRITSAESI
eukprot:m.66905 g.66905  ORF g.66905 m.66905 type:complete len:567 (-) comp11846_c0_seq1:272-1972(-)